MNSMTALAADYLPMKTLQIPQDVLESARLTIDQLKQELAMLLYAQQRLSVGKARELAGMTLWEFRQLLATRGIPVHYEVEDFTQELATLRELGRI
jgi:predicted HTH domain antitoxin